MGTTLLLDVLSLSPGNHPYFTIMNMLRECIFYLEKELLRMEQKR